LEVREGRMMKDNSFSELVEQLNKKFGHTYLEGVLEEPTEQQVDEKQLKLPLAAKAERKGG